MPAARASAQRLDDVGARVALVEVRQHGSSSDSTAETTNEAAERGQLRQGAARWRRRCSTFAVKSNVSVRELGVERAGDGERVAGPVEEIGIAEA